MPRPRVRMGNVDQHAELSSLARLTTFMSSVIEFSGQVIPWAEDRRLSRLSALSGAGLSCTINERSLATAPAIHRGRIKVVSHLRFADADRPHPTAIR